MSTWTVVGLYDGETSVPQVVAVLPGDVTANAATPPARVGFHPVLRAVTAPGGPDAVATWLAELEGSEPMPVSSSCRSCRNREGGDKRLRDAVGHDGPGHRLSNLLSRNGVDDDAALLSADLGELTKLPGFGAGSPALLRRARRRLRGQ